MKKFSEMTEQEFQKEKRDAEETPLSPFAQFMADLVGYDLFNLAGEKVDKYEAWDLSNGNIFFPVKREEEKPKER